MFSAPGLRLLAAVTVLRLLASPALAVEFPDGRTAFSGDSPRLESVTTTVNDTSARSARYYVTLTLPAGSEEPLQQVAIAQRRGEQAIEFDLADTIAFVGTRAQRGRALAIADLTYDTDRATLRLQFVEPIAPGTTFSLGLWPRRNPRWGGVYSFGVTVFPAGDQPQPLYLGSGRLQFYERDRHFFWR